MREAAASALRHLKAQGTWVLVGRLYLSAAAVISSVVVARLLTQEEYGQYKYLMAGLSLVAVLSLPGAFEVVVRSLPRGRFGVFRRLFTLRLRFGIAAAIAFVLFWSLSTDPLTDGPLALMIGVSLLVPWYLATQLYVAGHQAQMNFRALSFAQATRATAQLLSFVLIFGLFGSIYIALFAMLASLTFIHYFFYRRFVTALPATSGLSPETLRTAARDAFNISAFSVLPTLSEWLDRIIVQATLGFDSLAIYSIGLTLGLSVNAFFKPFLNSVNARLVHKQPRAQHYWLLFLAGTLLGISLAALLPSVVPFMYGAAYADSAQLASVLLYSMGVYFVRTLYFNYAMFNKGRDLRVVYASNVANAISVLCYIACVILFLRYNTAFLVALIGAYPFRLVSSMFWLRWFSRIYA